MCESERDERGFMCGVIEGFYGRPWTTAQRKDLFVKMKNFGLNTYMYAPKDDFKHRAYWRELYSVEEGEQLAALISCCKENGVTFYYAVSPGLDMVYSNPKEVNCLKRKLEQVSHFGCDAFALLFDDIEPEISETDKEVFQSFGHAQVSVTNEVYQSLGQPKFIFCPTEYCASRAIPNVHNSDYLNILGSKLLPAIDIMWTGNKVISKNITVQSIQELSEVLKRNPVIWDNIHANDYDQKRIFLGPYSGRSTQLNAHLRGVLTNPNCEYEPNFIAIHTLAQWSKCNSDVKCDNVSSDIKLETENESASIDNIPTCLSATTYHPRKALRAAVEAWLPEFNESKVAYGKPNDVITTPLAAVIPTLTIPPPLLLPNNDNIINDDGSLTLNEKCGKKALETVGESNFQPITKELANSLVTPTVILNPLEPMDCNASPALSPKHVSDAQMEEANNKIEQTQNEEPDVVHPGTASDSISKDNPCADLTEEMQTESLSDDCIEENKVETVSFEDVSLLVDLFYLPFEYGTQGVHILNEFQWLKTNGHLISDDRRQSLGSVDSPEVIEWFERAKKFQEISDTVDRLCLHLVGCKNLSLIYDLFPYVWDLRGAVSLLNSYVKWMALGKIPTTPAATASPTFTWFSKGYKEAFSSGDQEPWIFRGGLTGELQRLLPLESINDLFIYKSPELPSSRSYNIRPFRAPDEAIIYKLYNKSFLEFYETSNNFKQYPDLLPDRFVGGFITLCPEYCFVVEDANEIIGFALAALDARKYEEKLEAAWFPEMVTKYPCPSEKQEKGETLDSAEEMIVAMHQDQKGSFRIPDIVYKTHPSLLYLTVSPTLLDASVPKRLLSLVLTALKANGSHGACTRLLTREKEIIEFYLKLGFQEIQLPSVDNFETNELFLGRAI